MATKEQQARWREKAKATRVEIHLDAEALAALDQLATEIDPATGKPTGRSGAIRRLLLNPSEGSGKVLPVEVQHKDEPVEIEFWKQGEGRRTCQARNTNGERCRNETHGTGIRHRLSDGRIGLFDVCGRHNRSDLFQPHPSVLAKGPTT
jgi:hypothetical protein